MGKDRNIRRNIRCTVFQAEKLELVSKVATGFLLSRKGGRDRRKISF